jgi:hypothetical protein
MSHVALTSFTLDNMMKTKLIIDFITYNMMKTKLIIDFITYYMMKTKLIIVPCDNVTCSLDFLHPW